MVLGRQAGTLHITPLTSYIPHTLHPTPTPHNPHTPIPHLTPLQTKPFLTGPLSGEKAFEPCGVNEPLEQQLTLTVLEVTAARQLKLGPAQTPPHVTTHLCTLNCVCALSACVHHSLSPDPVPFDWFVNVHVLHTNSPAVHIVKAINNLP